MNGFKSALLHSRWKIQWKYVKLNVEHQLHDQVNFGANLLKNSLELAISINLLSLSSTFQVIAIPFDRLVLKLFQYTL